MAALIPRGGAVDVFVGPLGDIVSCVARAKINLSHGGWGVGGKIHASSTAQVLTEAIEEHRPALDAHDEERPFGGVKWPGVWLTSMLK
jgi:hypothetical protein